MKSIIAAATLLALALPAAAPANAQEKAPPPARLFASNAEVEAALARVRAEKKPGNNVVVVRFKGVNDRNAAEALTGTELFVDRSALPDEGEQDEFYHADLVGLKVRDDTGAEIGRVTAVQNFGGGDLLEVALSGRHEVLVPFSAAAVPEVAVAAGYIRIDPVAAGLVDNDDDVDDASAGPDGRRGFDPKRRPRGPADAGGNR